MAKEKNKWVKHKCITARHQKICKGDKVAVKGDYSVNYPGACGRVTKVARKGKETTVVFKDGKHLEEFDGKDIIKLKRGQTCY